MPINFPTPKIIKKEESKKRVLGFFKRLFIHDWLMKLLALVITLTLWLGVTGLQTPATTRLRGVPLNLLIANDLEVTNDPVNEVDLVIKGVKQKVDQILPRDLTVSLDLSGKGPGDFAVPITKDNVKVDLPSGVEVVEVQPDKIAIKLEKVMEVTVPVRVETEGTPAAGFELYSTRVTPESVVVRGPQSSVEGLSFVSTIKIDISKAAKDFTVQQVALTVANPKIIFVSAATANVALRIGRKRVERLIIVPYETQSRRGRATITLFGPSDVLDKITPADLTIVQEADEGGKSQMRVILPPDVAEDVEVRNARFSG